MTETENQVIDWLAHGEVGASSRCMAMWLGFGRDVRDGQSYPYDPADFDRCLRLLQAVPGLRENIGKMRELGKVWAALSRRWNEIEALHEEEVGTGWTKARSAPRTYALMKEVINSATGTR